MSIVLGYETDAPSPELGELNATHSTFQSLRTFPSLCDQTCCQQLAPNFEHLFSMLDYLILPCMMLTLGEHQRTAGVMYENGETDPRQREKL